MSKLRHDLLTSGWAMIDCGKYLDGFNHNWQEAPRLEFKYWGLLPQVFREFMSEVDWLLHEALYDEKFKATGALAVSNWAVNNWHQDYGYFTVLFSCRGEGTIVARSFENNVTTPYGYALILSGTSRQYSRQHNQRIGATYHTSPHSAWDRRLFLMSFAHKYDI